MTGPYQSEAPRRGSPLSRGFLPLALITLGVVFLLGNLVPESGRGGLFLIGLGAAFVIGRVATGRYGYAVPGGILAAIGAYISLQHTLDLRGIGSAGSFFILLGLGFALVYAIGLQPYAVWPLFPAAILVFLGLVLLGVASLGPLASFSWIAGYWPVALVLLGAWLLVRESLPAAARRPIATLGGLALLAYGILAAAASVAAGGAMARTGAAPNFGSPPYADTTATVDHPIAAGQILTVSNPGGSTTIRGVSGSDVHVVATRHFNFGGQAPEVTLVPTSDGLSLETSASRGRFPFFGPASSADYVIDVPTSVGVNVQSASGSITLTDVTGDVRATTTSGSIHGTGLEHVRQAQSTSGSISLEGVFTDAAQIQATSGSVTLHLLPGSAEQLDVHSASGSIQPSGLLGLTGGVTRRDTLTGAIGTPAPGATLSVNTTSGSIFISQ